jgi:hypothetical protein
LDWAKVIKVEADKDEKTAANKLTLAQVIAQQEGSIEEEEEDLATPGTSKKRPAPGEGDLFETPKAKRPAPTHLSGKSVFNKMPHLNLNVKAAMDKKLEKVLPTCQGVAFAGDFWTSNTADPYLGMTMHYVDQDFELHMIMVACKLAEGRHTAVNIASHMDKDVSGIAGLKSTTTRFCLTDNAAAMLAAVPKLTKKMDVGFGCIDLIIKATNKAVTEIWAAIQECKDFSSRVHHTPLDQQRLKRECWNLRNDR